MLDFSVVLTSVFTMILLLIPGLVFERFKLAPKDFTKGLTNFTLFLAQPAMLIHSFLRAFDGEILKNLGVVFLLGIVGYAVMFLVVCLMFRKTETSKQGVLRFMMMFTNAGFMGLPVLQNVFGAQGDLAVLYATGILVCHNVLTWTIGLPLLSGSSKGMGKKALINPGTVACAIGIILFLTSAVDYLPKPVTDVVSMLSSTVTPLAMFIVGAHLAHFDVKSIFKQWRLLVAVGMRLFVLPLLVFGCFILIKWTGLLPLDNAMLLAVPFLQLCMPSASVTTMMAQRYGGDTTYASAGVSLSTLLSVVSIPLMSLLIP